MPLNLLKKYNSLLDLIGLNEYERRKSLKLIFDRDFTNNASLRFKNKQVRPTPENGVIPMETLFSHLTTVITDKTTRSRDFEYERSIRLHWVRFHIDESKTDEVLHFSVLEPEGIRTYIYDIIEKYVVVLEPLKKIDEYYLLTAYYLTGKDAKRNKILQKYKRRIGDLY
jgi:hypothetical protein